MLSKKRFKKETVLTYSMFAVIAIVTLILAYQNIFPCYGFMDDYTVAYHAGDENLLNHFLSGGRPLYGILTKFLYVRLGTICELKNIRIISLIGIVFFSILLFRAYRLAGWEKLESGCAAIVTCLMPAFEVYAAWAVEFIVPFGMSLTLIAGELCLRSYDRRGVARARLKMAIMLSICMGLLLASLMMYQFAVQAFWLFIAIALLKPNENSHDFFRKGIYCFIIFSISVIIYFILFKTNVWPFTVAPLSRSHLTTEPLNKLLWFFKAPLFDALSLTAILKNKQIIICTVTVTLSFILCGLFCRIKRIAHHKYLFIFVVLSLLPLAYMSNLASAENWSSFRTQAVLSALIVFYLLLSFKEIFQSRMRKIILPGFVFICLIMAYNNVTDGFVIPQKQELNIVRHATAAALSHKPDKIVFIRPSWKDSIAKKVRYDEFGLPSTSQLWVPVPLIKLILREINNTGVNQIEIECYAPNSSYNSKKGDATINMGEILRAFNQKKATEPSK